MFEKTNYFQHQRLPIQRTFQKQKHEKFYCHRKLQDSSFHRVKFIGAKTISGCYTRKNKQNKKKKWIPNKYDRILGEKQSSCKQSIG